MVFVLVQLFIMEPQKQDHQNRHQNQLGQKPQLSSDSSNREKDQNRQQTQQRQKSSMLEEYQIQKSQLAKRESSKESLLNLQAWKFARFQKLFTLISENGNKVQQANSLPADNKSDCIASDQKAKNKQIVPDDYSLAQLIKEYSMMLIKNEEDENFFQHFVENKFISTLMAIMKTHKFASEIVKGAFESLELLLKGLKREDQFVYLMVCISREGFVDDTNYSFKEQEDMAYFANFLKILARKINEDEKYLSVFFNSKEPEFPLLKNLLKFHSSKDVILHTSAKLTIMQLSANRSKNPMLQNYLLNFPFVIFFPSYTYPALQALEMAVKLSLIENLSGNDLYEMELQIQNLRNDLKYMEDFVSSMQERQSVDMYANTFFSLLGRKIYRLLLDKNSVHRTLKLLYNIILKQVTIQKIRIGMRQMLEKIISVKLQKFLMTKTSYLDSNYWLLSECEESVKQHCRALFHNDIKMAKRSLIRTMNSYIPKSRNYWFYQQTRKISQMIGVWIEVDKPINQDVQMESSYLSALDSVSELTPSNSIPNPVYQILTHPEKQQTLFWYLKISKELHITVVVEDCLQQLKVCTSLALVKAFYEYVVSEDLFLKPQQESVNTVKELYQQASQKLIFFIIKEGWVNFKNRAKYAFQKEENGALTNSWNHDAFRDLEVDIVFFVTLRHLLGTSNDTCIQPTQQLLESRDFISPGQVKVPCKLTNSQGNNIILQLNGQYLKVFQEEDTQLTKGELNLREFRFQNDGQGADDSRNRSITLVDKITNRGIVLTLYFLQESVLGYMVREFTKRKTADADIWFALRHFKFAMN